MFSLTHIILIIRLNQVYIKFVHVKELWRTSLFFQQALSALYCRGLLRDRTLTISLNLIPCIFPGLNQVVLVYIPFPTLIHQKFLQLAPTLVLYNPNSYLKHSREFQFIWDIIVLNKAAFTCGYVTDFWTQNDAYVEIERKRIQTLFKSERINEKMFTSHKHMCLDFRKSNNVSTFSLPASNTILSLPRYLESSKRKPCRQPFETSSKSLFKYDFPFAFFTNILLGRKR